MDPLFINQNELEHIEQIADNDDTDGADGDKQRQQFRLDSFTEHDKRWQR